MVDGYKAILVPIILEEEINSSLLDDMSPKGYRVAIFQYNYSKDDILLGFRDYHPNEQIVREQMLEKKIGIYPSDFIAFYDVLGENFTGHILHLDSRLRPIRLTEVFQNGIVKYLNIPSEDSIDENPLIEYPNEDIFSIQDSECQIQIAYPDLEISYIEVKYGYNGASGQTGSNSGGFSLYGFGVVSRRIGSYNLVWNTMSIPSGGCSNSSTNDGGISNGVAFPPTPGGYYPNFTDDCIAKRRIMAALGNLDKINAINNYYGLNGERVEAGYNVFVHDLLQLSNTEVSKVYSDNLPQNVNVPFSWSRDEGYVLHTSHSHPNGMPPSLTDIFAIGAMASQVANASHSLVDQKFIFQNYYTDVIEVGNGKFYAMTIKDVDRLVLKTAGNSVGSYVRNLQSSLNDYRDFLNRSKETPEK